MAIDKEGRFVPRQRKRKALDRARDKHAETDSNLEALPEQNSAHKTRLRTELKPEGVRFSSKKAKRLEKYIENKLKKDESKELLAKLAETRIDTSLLSSSRSLGQTKESKKEAVRRAFREENAGLELDEARKELLYERRRTPVESDEDGDSAALKTKSEPKLESLERPAALGSGLKRPLETDGSGRPVLAKRQKRGGVKSKTCFVPEVTVPDEDDVSESEWNGFSSEALSDCDVDRGDAEVSGSDSDDGGTGDSDDDDSDSDDAAAAQRRKERSFAFKEWAHQRRNEALGYQSIGSGGPGALEMPIPKDFKPRPLEQDELPPEFQPTTTNASRKAYSVTVTRETDIQNARLKLPVVAEEQRIMEAIHNNDVVVICGATGSGKTTQVPQFLFEAGYGSKGSPTAGMIGVTQPRRVAAVSMSKRVAQELGDHGPKVAYQIRFEGTANANTAIKFMTDGVLLREVAQDIALRKYSAIIIDEAHERSVNTDILIGMLSRVVKLRAELAEEDQLVHPLKLVIMSATLRIEDFALNTTLFPTPPPVIDVEGRQHNVTIHFARKTYHDYVQDAFRKISRGHRQLPPGGMLVFLTGQAEVLRLSKLLKSAFGGMHSAVAPKVRIPASQAPQEVEDVDFGEMDDRNVNDVDDDVDPISDDEDEREDGEFELQDEKAGSGPARMQILPLYSLLPTREQMKVFEPPPDGARQVILATNVAETSLTIPGIRYVFDCGRSKERRYERLSGVQSFEVGWISKASANQRSGRAGRTGPGHCWRLYSSAVYERDFPEHTDPEMLRMPIDGVVLQLKAMHLQHVVNFPFPTPPDRESLAKAEKTLMYLSAISPEGQVTKIGSAMSLFPLSPRFARILLMGHLQDCIQYAVTLVAGLSVPEIFIPENQVMPALPEPGSDGIRTAEDVISEDKRDKLRKAFNAAHRNMCFLDDKSDAIKMLQVVGEFAHEPTEAWCESRFVRYKALKESQQLRRQLVELLKTNMAAFASLKLEEKLPAPTSAQVQALKQMVAVGFIDQVAIRADMAPNPPPAPDRKPRRATEVPYLPLTRLHGAGTAADQADNLVYLHPTSPLAHLAVVECPQYVVYAHLQRAGNVMDEKGARKPKTRMHALTDVTGAQLANLAKGTPLLTYGKPIKEVKSARDSGSQREVWVVPYLRAETAGGRLGWPLPARRVKQRKIPGKGWVEDTA